MQNQAIQDASKNMKQVHQGAYCHVFKPLSKEQQIMRDLRARPQSAATKRTFKKSES